MAGYYDMATGDFIPDTASPINSTAAPSSQLDTGGGLWGSLSGGLSKMLDVYTTVEVAKYQSSQLPKAGATAGYMRVPGSGEVVPSGTFARGAGGMSMTTMALIGGGLLVLVLLLKKG